MRIMSLLFIIGLFISGCSTKYEHPIELDNSSFTVIHENLMTKHTNIVPKDVSMAKRNWFYRLKLKKQNGDLLKNTQIIKTFYLVDHANYILIKGNKKLINEYKQYFRNNGATAQIHLKEIKTNSNKVTVLLSHNKQYIKG